MDVSARAKVDPPKARPRRWRRSLFWCACAMAGTGGVAAGTVVGVVRHYESDLPSVADLRGNYHPPQVTRVLARDGSLLGEIFTERRTVVPVASLPPHVKLAVLAAEDAGFYEHEGLDYLGIARAFVVNLRSGKTRQGGSTITQQVVKNLLLDPERTYRRKLREALLARRLEQELTKDEILELYLNHIYFGHGRYGIEEAARDNFGKPAHKLTLGEAALLAGLVAGPESFSPRRDLSKAISRRDFVLDQMREKGFLDGARVAAAKAEAVRIAEAVEVSSELAPEAMEHARKLLLELEPTRARQGGFTVHTTLDPKAQRAARKAVRDALVAYDKRHGLQGPLKAPVVPRTAVAPSGGPSGSKRSTPPLVPPVAPRVLAHDAAFEGMPRFEQHKVLVGVVVGTSDDEGTIDVRVGEVLGSLRLADGTRYNPQGLKASEFAPVGARMRVSLAAPVVDGSVLAGREPSAATARTPLRWELGPEGALVAVDVRTRGVLALVGNYEAAVGGLDRAIQARRQPGSTFKPIVYSYALHSRRFTPASLVDPNPEAFEGGYRPANYEGFTGSEPLRLREALAQSVNVVAVRVLRDVGPMNVVGWAQALGIRSKMEPDLSLALGSYEVSPMELCGAYATFAAGGTFEEPRLVTRIVGPGGMEVPLRGAVPARRVMDEAEAFLITHMMMSVVDHGTAVRAKGLGRPLAGKTGTSNGAKDTWFAGFSAEVAAVVWVGFDDGKLLGRETGASAALPAWMDAMKVMHEGKPPVAFAVPAGVVRARIDERTGRLAADGAANSVEELFLEGTEPRDDEEGARGAGAAGEAALGGGEASEP